jgi:hypothetical protein
VTAPRPLSFTELEHHSWCGRAIELTRGSRRSRGRAYDRPVPAPLQLGLLAHGVLEATTTSGLWPCATWESRFDASWPEVNAAIEGARVTNWKRLPGAQLVRLTLRRWLSDPEVIGVAIDGLEAETPVHDGALLVGMPDVVLGGPAHTVLWDLKTGASGDIVDDRTRRQLDLYAGLLRASGRQVDRVGVIGKAGWTSEAAVGSRADVALESAREVAHDVQSVGAASTRPEVDACIDCRWLAGCNDGLDGLADFGTSVEVLEPRSYATGHHALVRNLTRGETQVVGPLVAPVTPQVSAVMFEVGDATRIVTLEDTPWPA